MNPARILIIIAATTLTVATIAASTSEGPATAGTPAVGIGGAGAFISPSHVNGPFGAGGPLAGIGGAGAFIPHT